MRCISALLSAAILLVGCDQLRPEPPKPPGPSLAEQRASAARIAASAPVPIVHKVGEHELLVLEIQSVNRSIKWLVDSQRCFVWRDSVYRTATMVCPDGEPARHRIEDDRDDNRNYHLP